MNLKDKNVLVTGGEGFIGSHLVERLVELGAHVTCFIKYHFNNNWGNLEYLPEETKKKITVVQGDIRDNTIMHTAIKGQDIVFNLAALIGIPYSYTNPKENFQTNVLGTFNVMQACLDNNVKKVIHTSTSEVYGTPKKLPLNEESPVVGQSPYSASKIGADKVAESFYYTYNLPVCILRPFNTFGPRQSARAIIPTIISQALNQEKIVLGNLHPTRDYTYVTDIVYALVKIAESDKTIGELLVVGSGKETSMKELAEHILKIMNVEKEIVQDDKRKRPEKSEVLRLCADSTKAQQLIGWKPKVTMEEGLKKSIEWVTEHLKNYKSGDYTT